MTSAEKMEDSSCTMELDPLDMDLGVKLKIEDSSEQQDCPKQQPSRNLRRRLPLKPAEKLSNRRVQMKPTKRKDSDAADLTFKNITFKRTNSMETIFEEPKNSKKNSHTLIGGRKLIRAVNFSTGLQYTNEKIKKRRKNIKRFLGKSISNTAKKMDMATFLKKLKEMTQDDDIPDNL